MSDCVNGIMTSALLTAAYHPFLSNRALEIILSETPHAPGKSNVKTNYQLMGANKPNDGKGGETKVHPIRMGRQTPLSHAISGTN